MSRFGELEPGTSTVDLGNRKGKLILTDGFPPERHQVRPGAHGQPDVACERPHVRALGAHHLEVHVLPAGATWRADVSRGAQPITWSKGICATVTSGRPLFEPSKAVVIGSWPSAQARSPFW